MSYYLGVDIGTTSTKAVLFAENGSIVAMNHQNYPLYSPRPEVAEQDPDEIYNACKKAIANVMRTSKINPDNLHLVSFSTAMHAIIAVDRIGQPLTKSITWADCRATAWAEKILSDFNGHEIYRRTGTPIHPMSPFAKITWLRHDHPEIFDNTFKFIGIKEYIFFRFFGEYVVDHSIASAMGLFNLEKRDWDEEALSVAGITPENLSKLVPTTHVLRNLKAPIARELGLKEDTAFVIGANDGVLSNLGVNAIKPGVVAITIGTSGAIRTVVDHPVTDPKGRIFCYVLTEDKWVVGGPVNNGGMTLRWVRDELAASEVETAKRLGIDSYQVLTMIAERVEPGSGGLLFHPYLAGERAPLWDANARGSFFGLGLHTKQEHMIRAVLEGVIFNLYSVFIALTEVIGTPERIQATGGFAKSQLWCQMMSDIFNQPVTVPDSIESSCLGAIVLGMYALGEIKDFSIVEKWVGTTHSLLPKEENVKIYKELTPIYIKVSESLKESYKMIANFQKEHVHDLK
ncbi:sugar kinase, putative [Trichomonas vaginalis G3]|uniref:glycerol kinase n=1 Tax=Trichomonas vaginalis (strain ATCC PRA-98 / G3) TaxID=412133 RepID=A2FCA8_TRIV3|nr:gluconate kinase family [Trichomonas vaginalis G3]EAX97471.1 sugar kinase, putative [Trichomonas vaginalis G3]KAI5496575.1 gluconate kinase family [Trichomonas vaginalis G3]|eukprot:XP_001310401.1 sugar kinase [Trichomonas vaginalis G3]